MLALAQNLNKPITLHLIKQYICFAEIINSGDLNNKLI